MWISYINIRKKLNSNNLISNILNKILFIIDFFLASKNCYQKIIVLKIIKKILLKFQL